MNLRVEKHYYTNGNPFFEVSYLNKQKNGLSIFWWRNNMVDYIEKYKRDVRHGIQVNFEYTKITE